MLIQVNTRRNLSIAALCLLCGVLGYWCGVIVTTAEIISHFGADQAEQILQPVSDEFAFPQWRKA